MSREEIIVTVIAAVLSSSFLNGLITHFLYKNKLKKEQEIGHKNMIGERVKEALLEARELELQCTEQEVYKPEETFQEQEFSYFEDYAISLGITRDMETFFEFMSNITRVRKEYEQFLGFKEAAFLYYIERYCNEFSHMLGKYGLPFDEAGALFIPDFQRWQKRYEKLLVRKINHPSYKIYDKNKKGWEREKRRINKTLWKKSLLCKFENDKTYPEIMVLKAIVIDKDEKKAMELIEQSQAYDKKHFIKAFFRKIKNKM